MFLRGCWRALLYVCQRWEWLREQRWSHRKHWEYSKSGGNDVIGKYESGCRKISGVCSSGTECKTNDCSVAGINSWNMYNLHFVLCI